MLDPPGPSFPSLREILCKNKAIPEKRRDRHTHCQREKKRGRERFRDHRISSEHLVSDLLKARQFLDSLIESVNKLLFSFFA